MHKLALSSLVLLAACATHSGAQTGAAGQNDTLARIRALIGTPSCSEDSQCRSLAVGQRACGGPESYLAYSTARSSEAELRALGAIYQAERRKANAEAGVASDCSFRPDPGAVCRAGACVLGPEGAVAR
jgi:hypothetical protein